MAYPTEEKAVLAGKEAKFVSLVRYGVLRQRELTRRWDRVKDSLAESCVKCLEEYTDAGNAAVQYYVDSPVCSGPRGIETFAGRWRNFWQGRTKDAPQGITQVLREGYLGYSGTAGDPLDQTEARMGGLDGDPTTDYLSIIREWRQVNPADYETIVAALLAIATVTNPKIETETYTGVFACGRVKVAQNPDGSLTLRQPLTRITTVAAAATLTSLSPLITRNRDVMNLFGFEEGTEKRMLYVYSGIGATSETYVMETASDADIVAATAAGTWSLEKRKFDVDAETGAATYALLFRQDTWAATWATDKQSVQVSAASGYLRELAIQATGESKSQALTDFSRYVIDLTGATYDTGTYYNKGDIAVYSAVTYICIAATTGAFNAASWIAAHYLLNDRKVAERGQGEFVCVGQMLSVYDLTTDADAVVVFKGATITTTNRRFLRRVWYKRSAAAVTTLLTAVTGKAVIDYNDGTTTWTHMRHELEDHGNGAYTVRQTLGELFSDGATAPYFVAQIRPAITEYEQRMIVRTWRHLTTAAKNTLITPTTGLARIDVIFELVTYTHADCFIDDNEDEGWTVRQVAIEVHSGYAEANALVIRIQPSISTYDARVIQRVWLHRSTAAKNDLVGTVSAGHGLARTDYTYETALYSHADVHVEDLGHGAYNVTQTLVRLNAGVTIATAEYIRFVPRTGDRLRLIQRVWRNITEAAKTTLMTAGSAARPALAETIETFTYSTVETVAEPNGIYGWTVRQTLADLNTGDTTFYFAVDVTVYKNYVRTKDDYTRQEAYTQHIKMFATEKSAWEWIDAGTDVVVGSTTVSRVKEFFYRAKYLSGPDSDTGWLA